MRYEQRSYNDDGSYTTMDGLGWNADGTPQRCDVPGCGCQLRAVFYAPDGTAQAPPDAFFESVPVAYNKNREQRRAERRAARKAARS